MTPEPAVTPDSAATPEPAVTAGPAVTSGPPIAPRVPGRAVLTGEVADFDEQVGLGSVIGTDGGSWPFHCTQIADGTRQIAVGARVSFEVVPGRLGIWEAAGLRPAPAEGAP